MQDLYHQQDDKDPLLLTTTALRLKAVFPERPRAARASLFVSEVVPHSDSFVHYS